MTGNRAPSRKPWHQRLLSLGEESYRDFYAPLIPSLASEVLIGVRMPLLRAFAEDLKKMGLREEFLADLPHFYYEENMLHALFLSGEKDVEAAIDGVNRFLPYVDNWAVCDSLRPVLFRTHRREILPWVKKWTESGHPYTCRFGIEMLMLHFLGEDFQPWMMRRVARIRSEEYYVNMMVAWYFATALAEQEEKTRPYLEGEALSPFCRRKAIQKALESKRIGREQKAWLRNLQKK